MARNYAKEIDEALHEYEDGKSFHIRSTSWIADRINWCWKWRKITEEQMKNFADRMTKIFEGDY